VSALVCEESKYQNKPLKRCSVTQIGKCSSVNPNTKVRYSWVACLAKSMHKQRLTKQFEGVKLHLLSRLVRLVFLQRFKLHCNEMSEYPTLIIRYKSFFAKIAVDMQIILQSFTV